MTIEQLNAEIPAHITKFLDTLTYNELDELIKLDSRLVAKVYQAGAVFGLNMAIKQGK